MDSPRANRFHILYSFYVFTLLMSQTHCNGTEDETYKDMVRQATCWTKCFDSYGVPVDEKTMKLYGFYKGNTCGSASCIKCQRDCESSNGVFECKLDSCTTENCRNNCDIAASGQNSNNDYGLAKYTKILRVTKPKSVCKFNYRINNTSTIYLKWTVESTDRRHTENITVPQMTFVVQYQQRISNTLLVDKWTTIGLTNRSYVPINNLDFDTDYRFRITPVSMDGVFEPPVESAWIRTLPAKFRSKAPKTMRILYQTYHKKSVSARLSWEPNEGPPCFYRIYWMSSCGPETSDYAAEEIRADPVNDYWINNLRFGCNYTIKMHSYGGPEFINGSKALAYKFHTIGCINATNYNYSICTPAPPRNAKWALIKEYVIKNISYSDVRVDWDPPVHTSPTNNIMGYIIYWRKQIPLLLTETTPAHRGNSTLNRNNTALIKGIHMGNVYILRIHAVSQAGKGGPLTLHIDVDDHSREPKVNASTSIINQFGTKKNHLYLVIIILLVVTAISSILIVLLLRRNKKIPCVKKRNQRSAGVEEMNPIYSSFDAEVTVELTDEYEISFANIRFLSTLGEGAFGKVMKAELSIENTKNKPEWKIVAVKMLKDNPDSTERRNLMLEIEAMKHLGHHSNIVSIVGCCTKSPNICLIMDFCLFGDLRNYLLKFRHKYLYGDGCAGNQRSSDSGISRNSKICSDEGRAGSESNLSNRYMHLYSSQESINAESQDNIDVIEDKDPVFCQTTLLSYARQIAMGMEYLSQKKFIHRDLAARNILMCDDKRLKISDFGLTRDVYETNIYQPTSARKLPYKWMAIEAIFDQTFTIKSDVWSFGIVLWEIVTLAGTPYPGIPNKDIFRLLKDGYRMEKPENCSPEIYQLMLSCWHPNPVSRPSFTELRQKLESMLEVTRSYINLSVSVSEDYYQNDSSSSSSAQQCSSGTLKVDRSTLPSDSNTGKLVDYTHLSSNLHGVEGLKLTEDDVFEDNLQVNLLKKIDFRPTCKRSRLESTDKSKHSNNTDRNRNISLECKLSSDSDHNRNGVTKTTSLQTVSNGSFKCFHSSSPLGHRANDICRFCDFHSVSNIGYTSPVKKRTDNSTL